VTTLPPPGWYPDPTASAPGPKRWWDGGTWTEHVEASPAPVIAPVSSYDWGAEVSRYGEPEPKNRREFDDSLYVYVPSRSGTVSVWLIALAPIVSLLWAALIIVVIAATQSAFLMIIAALLWPLANLAWAVRDKRRLSQFGFLTPAQWAWIFLGPLAYLIARYVRTRKEAGIGKAPLVTYLAINGAFVVLSVALTLLAPTLVTPYMADVVETEIAQQELARTGIAYTVDCPESGDYFSTTEWHTCTVVDPATGAIGTTTAIFSTNAARPYSYTEPVFD